MEKYLSRCLESILCQDIDQSLYEIIVINDESTDNSLKIAKEYASKNKNIIVHNKKNAGLGAARNTGIKLAKGEYIFFLDTDDYIINNCLSKLLSVAQSNNFDILAFISSMTTADDLNTPLTKSHIDEKIAIDSGINYIANNNYRNEVWWYIVNKAFLIDTSILFDEGQWLEDALFTAKIFLEAKNVGHINFDIHRYRIRQDSAVRNKNAKHYKKMLLDQEKVISDFSNFINNLPVSASYNEKYMRRIKNRQQSFVFFYIIRFFNTNLTFSILKEKLSHFKEISAYPLNQFYGEEYNGKKYKILTKIFNSQKLLFLSFVAFCLFKKTIRY